MPSPTLSTYSRTNPYQAAVKERFVLNRDASKKCTFHVTLDLGESGIAYRPGDCIGIYPENGDRLVQRTLEAMKATGEESIFYSRDDTAYVLRDFLKRRANISKTSQKVLKELAARQTDPDKRAALDTLLADRPAMKKFLEERELWDLLAEHEEVRFTPQELCELLTPILPRLYSIASSQAIEGKAVSLTISHVRFQALGHERVGVCSDYLLQPETKQVSLYLNPTKDFLLPEDSEAPVIMIGPGTGIAPFRGFMQERTACGATGEHWLFFGEWTKANDFYYEEEWRRLEEEGKLRLDLAFSRDQEHKVYVQDRLRENGADVWAWLQKGAYLYVCGDAQRMAKDVDTTLHEIVAEHGNMNAEEAAEWIKTLKKEKRYLRDVY